MKKGKSAMFHGHPTVMQQLQKQMDAELIRIPYFSQTSDESYVYMTPSLNIAFNKNLEKDREKLDTALDVLDCMISEEGQKLIADGSGVISLNTDVPTMMQDVLGLEEEVVDWFGEYAKVVAENFSDLCEYFITINEPQCVVGLGHLSGVHAPGLKLSIPETFQIAHNLLKAHGQAVINLRKYAKQKIQIGFAPTGGVAYPYTDSGQTHRLTCRIYRL